MIQSIADLQRRFGSMLLLLGLVSLGLPAGQAQQVDAFEQNRRLGRGVNIIGYDPLWRSRTDARFQEKHFRLLKEAGFQSVRINLHAFGHMDKSQSWLLRPTWFETLDWAVSQTTNAGLQAILDCHEFNRMGEAPEEHKAQFLAFWKQISAHYEKAPPSVMFEILNEPNKKLTPALWNQYLAEALTLIRERNPTRTVIVGPAFWNSVDHLKELDLPATDRNLIVTVHYYKPMEFTHQGASWSSHKVKRGINWGSDSERQAVRDDFSKVNSWAKEQQRPILLGEFGAYDQAPLEARIRYTDFVARAAEDLGWSWSYWQFDSDFILWDMKADRWFEPILKALIPPKRP